MGIQLSKDNNHDETRSSSSGSSNGKKFGRRSTRPGIFKKDSGSGSIDHHHQHYQPQQQFVESSLNSSRAAALKAFKEKQVLKQQQKNARKYQKQQQQIQQQQQQYNYHVSSSPSSPPPLHVQQQQQQQQPTSPIAAQQRPHQPSRRPSHSADSIESSGRSSSNTQQSSGRSGSSYQDMSLEERLNLLNLTGGRGLPPVEGTAYGHINFGDEQEYNRQLRLHYVLKQVMSGNVKVEFNDPPELILDCACGAGFWSLDMGQAYPDCQVVALDIALPEDAHLRQEANSKANLAADGVPNITYMHGDVLSLPLQFGDNTFDFVYQREMGTVIPDSHWPQLIQDFYRLLKPNGLIQLVEYPLQFPACGPLSDIVNNWVQTEATANGLNIHFIDGFERYLDEAGFEEINTHVYEFPVGEWPKDERERQQGFLQKDITRLLLKQMKPFLSKALEMEADVYDQFAAAVMSEFEENHGTTIWKVVTGRKKGRPEKGNGD